MGAQTLGQGLQSACTVLLNSPRSLLGWTQAVLCLAGNTLRITMPISILLSVQLQHASQTPLQSGVTMRLAAAQWTTKGDNIAPSGQSS